MNRDIKNVSKKIKENKEKKEMKNIKELLEYLKINEVEVSERYKEFKMKYKERFEEGIVEGCGMQFNFLKDCKWRSDELWDVIMFEKEDELKENYNMFEVRMKVWNDIRGFIKREGIRFEDEKWWNDLNIVYGNDNLKKKVKLLKMILKENKVRYYREENDEIIVDYNIMSSLKYYNLIKGNDLEKLRIDSYKLIEEGLRLGFNCSKVDGCLFKEGRRVRKEVNVIDLINENEIRF